MHCSFFLAKIKVDIKGVFCYYITMRILLLFVVLLNIGCSSMSTVDRGLVKGLYNSTQTAEQLNETECKHVELNKIHKWTEHGGHLNDLNKDGFICKKVDIT